MLLELLKDVFSMCEKMLTSNYKVKKIVKDFGLHYEKIYACQNSCVIYYEENAQLSQCLVCGDSRWKPRGKCAKGSTKRVPWKILRYFPITPRLQRVFMSSKIAADMRWHFENRVKDGLLRHSIDCEA